MYDDLMPGSYAGYGYGQNNGLFDSLKTSWNTDPIGLLGGVGNLAAGLYGMYQSGKMMDMYEDQLDIQKDKWAESKAELNHMRQARKRITDNYMGRPSTNQSSAYSRPF